MPHRNLVGILFILLALNISAVVRAGDSAVIAVAWAENGTLTMWKQGDSAPQILASDAIIRPFLSPDGQHIAFVRGDGVLASSLWIIQADGDNEREIVGSEHLTADEPPYIAQVTWLDDETLYFNTLRKTTINLQPQNDLWRANISTGEVQQVLDAGEGGRFSISPNREQIAIIYPGIYGQPTGRIRLLDPVSLVLEDKLEYAGISTGAEYPFYPEVFWEDDGSALLVAIPDKDLVYDDVNSPPTVLWRLPAAGEREQIGSVPASFFGQPRWSSDGTTLTYLQRIGEPTSNQFALVVADGNGREAVEYDSGQAGFIGQPVWIPGTRQFVYGKDAPGSFYLGAEGEPPRHLGDGLFSLQLVDSTDYIYATPTSDGLELRAAKVDGTASTVIGLLLSNTFVYNVRIIAR
jgi:hypothetical protein